MLTLTQDRARRILLQLRDAAREPNGDDKGTRLIIADFMLPLACVDDFGSKKYDAEGQIEGVEGAEQTLAPAPLLANLGKASANAYWMDLTVCLCVLVRWCFVGDLIAFSCAYSLDASNVQRSRTYST